jgi:hypothetical protein
MLGIGGCSGGSFSADGQVSLEIYPDVEGKDTTLPMTVAPMGYEASQDDKCK